MKKLIYTGFVALLAISAPRAATYCTQKFKLLQFEGADTTSIVYQEEIWGECEDVFTHSIVCAQTDIAVKAVLRIPLPGDSSSLDDVVELVANDSTYLLPDSGWFRAPQADSSILKMYQEVGASYHSKVWYDSCTANCLQDPEFEGAKARRLFYSPSGLYIDYGIKKAFFQEATGLLLIFTDQPRVASGMDTMHGVLLYRITH